MDKDTVVGTAPPVTEMGIPDADAGELESRTTSAEPLARVQKPSRSAYAHSSKKKALASPNLAA
jgi:hypothetical protein